MLPTDLIRITMKRVLPAQPLMVTRLFEGSELMDETHPDAINRIIGEMATELDARMEDVTDPKP